MLPGIEIHVTVKDLNQPGLFLCASLLSRSKVDMSLLACLCKASQYWPNISMGLIKGVPALAYEDDSEKDSERLRMLISLTTWAIWKSGNKSSMNDQKVTTIEAGETLSNLISNLVRSSWNAARYMEGGRRLIQQSKLRSLWADKWLADLDLKIGPTIVFT